MNCRAIKVTSKLSGKLCFTLTEEIEMATKKKAKKKTAKKKSAKKKKH